MESFLRYYIEFPYILYTVSLPANILYPYGTQLMNQYYYIVINSILEVFFLVIILKLSVS